MLQLEEGYGNGWQHLMSLYGGLKAGHKERVGFHVHLPPSFQGHASAASPAARIARCP